MTNWIKIKNGGGDVNSSHLPRFCLSYDEKLKNWCILGRFCQLTDDPGYKKLYRTFRGESFTSKKEATEALEKLINDLEREVE